MDRPNIVFIMADDLGYGDVGCYNPGSKIPTPHMDRLAAAGRRFTDAHSPSAVCTPTRYGVLSGRYCWRTDLKQGVIGGYGTPLIEPERLTVASMLKLQGYATACIGKWHVGATFQDGDGNPTREEREIDFSKPVLGGPAALGFDYAWFNAGCGTCAPPYGFIENEHFVDEVFRWIGDKRDRHGRVGGMEAEGWVTRDADVIIADKACRYIEDQAGADRPFFLYLTPNAAHEPCMEEYVPEFARGRSAAGARGDLVWLFDWIVGEVVQTLERTGQLDNTLIVVTSDNGALPGDFERDADGLRLEVDGGNREFVYQTYDHASCGDWRGYKAHIWEGGHREPLIVSWPGRIAAGTTSDALVCLTDFMASCAALTGFDLPNDAAEDSFAMPLLFSDADGGGRNMVIHHSSHGVFAIRHAQWKLILDCPDSGGWPTPRGTKPQPGARGQLYDIVNDPAEVHNLWDDEPEVLSRLKTALEGLVASGRSAPLR